MGRRICELGHDFSSDALLSVRDQMRCEDDDSMPTGAHVDHGDINAQGGVASAYVAAWTDAFGVASKATEHAAADVPPLIDTSVSKPRESHKRPSKPELRYLAWAADQLSEVRAAVAAGSGS